MATFVNPYSQHGRYKFRPVIAQLVNGDTVTEEPLVRVLKIKQHPEVERPKRIILYVSDNEHVFQCLIHPSQHVLVLGGLVAKNDWIRMIKYKLSRRKVVGANRTSTLAELELFNRVYTHEIDWCGKPPYKTPSSSAEEITRLCVLRREEEARKAKELQERQRLLDYHRARDPQANLYSKYHLDVRLDAPKTPTKVIEIMTSHQSADIGGLPPPYQLHDPRKLPAARLSPAAVFTPPTSNRKRKRDPAGYEETLNDSQQVAKRAKPPITATSSQQTAIAAKLKSTLNRIQSRTSAGHPVEISSLSSVRHHYDGFEAGQGARPQVKSINVLGYVTWVGAPQMRPIGLKRDFRLRDPSLDPDQADVVLSIWDEPEALNIPVGTLVLFCFLKTHHFDNGSLNAYQNECKTKAWVYTGSLKIEHQGVATQHIWEWWEARKSGTTPTHSESSPFGTLHREANVPPTRPQGRTLGPEIGETGGSPLKRQYGLFRRDSGAPTTKVSFTKVSEQDGLWDTEDFVSDTTSGANDSTDGNTQELAVSVQKQHEAALNSRIASDHRPKALDPMPDFTDDDFGNIH